MSRRFYLDRIEDESGVSGKGRVAEGCAFDNGKVILAWNTIANSLGIYDTIGEVEEIHGHGGKTKIVWIDPEPKDEGYIESWKSIDAPLPGLCVACGRSFIDFNKHFIEEHENKDA